MPTEEIGISYREHDGRVPEKGWWRNTVCLEFSYIISGRGTLFIDEETFALEPGDLAVIKPNSKHRLVAEQITMLTITSPNWYKEQCELLSDS